MSNIIIVPSTSFAVPVSWVGSSEAAGFPASAVSDVLHPYRAWKATDCVVGSTMLTLDFGVSTTLIAVALINVNVRVVLYHSANAVDFTQTTLELVPSLDPRDGLYKLYIPLDAWTHRAIRFVSNTNTPSDGAAVMRIGIVVPILTATPFVRNPGFPYDVTPLRAVLTNTPASGGRETTVIGNRYAQLTFHQNVIGIDGLTEWLTWIGLGESEPFLYYRNNDDVSQVYIAKRVGTSTISQVKPNVHGVSSVMIETMA